MKPMILAAAVGAGVTVATVAYQSIVSVGVVKERARVESQGAKTNAKVAQKQRAIERAPAHGLLDRWSRD